MGRLAAVMAAMAFMTGCGLQERLLYYPDKTVPAEAAMAKRGIRFWPSRDGYRGFIGTAPDGKAKATVIIFHGNAATAADRGYYTEPLRRLGYRVILAEYPGYGARDGKLGEQSFVEDARETVLLVEETFGRPIFLLGESLGGAVAASALGAGVEAQGLILVTPWEKLESVAREKFPWLPVRFFLADPYDTAANLRKFPGPVAVVVAARDEVIPPRHAEALFDGFAGLKRMWRVAGAGHNDWALHFPDTSWREMMKFLEDGS
jgi:pimeloyl-ACP methyl ester carboxylesterase